MLTLCRTVRFSLLPLPAGSDPLAEPRHNPHAGWPSAAGPFGAGRGVGAYTEIDVIVEGEPDPVTGYLVNITILDAAVRESVVGWLTDRFANQFRPPPPDDASGAFGPIEPCRTTRLIAERLNDSLGRTFRSLPASAEQPPSLRAVSWRIAPTVRFTHDLTMPDLIEIRQRFEFSASHRLNCPSLDAAANRAIFGKCNAPNGHGHNYQCEVAVLLPIERAERLPIGTLDRVVDETVIRRFDHTHLNLDTVEFASLNPSVEHIAKVCHDLLVPALAAHDATLSHITVWETEKTSCTYPARPHGRR
jgi:6-pyruvoyltetrahydropterin/6-carboxytetrahydropterin synthase